MLVRTRASWILTVVVLCDHFQHTSNNSLLHTPLIDVLGPVSFIFPGTNALTRRALLSVGVETLFFLATQMISSLHVSLAAGQHSDTRDNLSGSCSSTCRRRVCTRQCVCPSETSTSRYVSTLRRSWAPSSSVAERHAWP